MNDEKTLWTNATGEPCEVDWHPGCRWAVIEIWSRDDQRVLSQHRTPQVALRRYRQAFHRAVGKIRAGEKPAPAAYSVQPRDIDAEEEFRATLDAQGWAARDLPEAAPKFY